MKNSVKLSLICLALVLFVSCKKDIPSDKLNFIGTWECTSCASDEEKTVIIKENGTGSYESIAPGKQVKFAGHIRFDGSVLKIGGALIKKKLKITKPPFREELSLVPFVVKWTLKLDGVEYLKTSE